MRKFKVHGRTMAYRVITGHRTSPTGWALNEFDGYQHLNFQK